MEDSTRRNDDDRNFLILLAEFSPVELLINLVKSVDLRNIWENAGKYWNLLALGDWCETLRRINKEYRRAGYSGILL